MTRSILVSLLLLFVLRVVPPLPYLVYWSNITFDEGRDDWVETQRFDGAYLTLEEARDVARTVALKHRNERTFPVEVARFTDEGVLTCFELYYTGGGHVIRIRDGSRR